MFIYDDKNSVKFIQSIASASTLVSSVTGQVRDFILSRFPSDFFKHTYIDTSEGIHQYNRSDKYDPTLNKIQYPNISISPEISLDDPIEGMSKSYHMSGTNIYMKKDVRRNYKTLLLSPKDKYSIHYTSDYITMNFNFKILTNKYIQNVDLAYYLKSRFQDNFFMFLNDQTVSTEIPKSFIKMVAEVNDIELYDKHSGNINIAGVEKLQMLLVSLSSGKEDYITKKIHESTGKVSFFINDKVNFLINVRDIDAPSSVIRDGMGEGEYQASFVVQVSTWLANAFIFSIDKESLQEKINFEFFKKHDKLPDDITEGFVSYNIPLNNFPDDRILEKNSKVDSNKKLIFNRVLRETFRFNLEEYEDEVVVSHLLDPKLLVVVRYAQEKNIDIRDLLFARYFTVDNTSPTDMDIYFDDISEELYIKKEWENDNDYLLEIFVNRLLYETLLKASKKDTLYPDLSILTMITLNINGVNHRLKVYSFKDDSELYSDDPAKSLRIMTYYGIGYIGLLPYDPDKDESFNVVVGEDANGNPIIMSLDIVS